MFNREPVDEIPKERPRARSITEWLFIIIGLPTTVGAIASGIGATGSALVWLLGLIYPQSLAIPSRLLPSPGADPAQERVLSLETAWRKLQANYMDNDQEDRVHVVNAAVNLLPYLDKLTDRQKIEFGQARDFARGWQGNTRDEWEFILARHPADELTPIARHEEEQVPQIPPPIQYPAGRTRSLYAVETEVIEMTDFALAAAQKGDCARAQDILKRAGDMLVKYKIDVAFGKRHNATELKVQQHLAAALQEKVRCEALNSAYDQGTIR